MRQFVIPSLFIATLFAAAGAQAAATTELKVTGTVKPPACTPSFAGGTVIDYGKIAATSLNQNAPTLLSEKAVSFSVTCDAAIRLSIKAVDNRMSSVIPGLIASVPVQGSTGTFPDSYARGLGTVDGKKIGVYNIRLQQDTFSADGSTVDLIHTQDGGVSWVRSGGGNFLADGSQPKSFAAPGTVTPGAYKTMTGTLSVQAVIDKASNLPLNQDVPLDGSSTIEVTYL